jgi:putative membrane protein
MDYSWIKALHIISVIAWMAGLLYLPRLFVYQALVEPASARAEMLKLMQRRLLKAIMNPAMIASWVFGLWMLAANPGLLQSGWVWVKLAAVVGMTTCHMVFARMRRQLEADDYSRSDKAYRVWNEVPTLLMIVIVILAVVKPF